MELILTWLEVICCSVGCACKVEKCMCFNEPGWLGLQLRREGDIYSIPTTYSTQSEKDTRNVSKGGGIISDQPTGRCTVPTVHLRSGAERIRCLKLLRQHNSVLVTKHFHKYCQCIIVLGLKFDSISTSSDNFFFSWVFNQ